MTSTLLLISASVTQLHHCHFPKYRPNNFTSVEETTEDFVMKGLTTCLKEG